MGYQRHLTRLFSFVYTPPLMARPGEPHVAGRRRHRGNLAARQTRDPLLLLRLFLRLCGGGYADVSRLSWLMIGYTRAKRGWL